MSTGAVAAPARSTPHAAGTDRARAQGERRLAAILVAPALIVMIAVTAYPIIDAVVLSLQRADLRFPSQNKFIGLANYGHVLSAPVWWQDVLHTVIITVISVSIQFVLGMCLALVMHRVIFARGLVRGIALVPYAIVAVVAAYSWQLAFSLNSGWIPKLLGLTGDPLSHTFGLYVAIIIAEVWKNTPFMALLLLAGLALVPDELHEAARVDGATDLAALRADHAAADEAGDPRRAAVPHARRIPDLRHDLHLRSGRAGHRIDLDAQLLDAAQPAQPGPRLGGLGAPVRARVADRVRVHQGVRSGAAPGGSEA